MSRKLTTDTDLTAIADAIRAKSGISAPLIYPTEFVSAIQQAIQVGVDTSDANATANDMLSGKTAYVNGQKITGNIPNQGAQMITPGTTNQTISSGRYLTGTQTIKGDANLVASNIAQGVSIFGVTGTHSGADPTDFIENRDTWTSYENLSVSKIGAGAFGYCSNLSSINFPACTSIGSYAFQHCDFLPSVSFPACTNIGDYAFGYCSDLTTVNFPACTSIGDNAFYNCYMLTTINFPVCTNIGSYAFCNCTDLTSVNFPACTNIDNSAFTFCYNLSTVSFPVCTSINSKAFCECFNLTSLYLTGSSYVSLANSNAFSYTPIGGSSSTAGQYGSIYVPASMLASYKTKTNWTYFSSRFVGV